MKFNEIRHTQKFKLPSTATVFQAEIKGILEAAKKVRDMNEIKYIKFYVDSQAALLALEAPSVKSKLVLDAIHELNEAGRGRTLSLHWTRAHVGTRGNEIADELAKEGGISGIPHTINLPKSEIKAIIYKNHYKQWSEDWVEYNGARMTKFFLREAG